ncbi:hypothetical protein [Micromonospora sp. NBC_01796]|uniref:hypothetical protein n=1 Tax=Micromonospora sp. NBC_01796 TaxID=2975987 RepID=UPI002DDC6429|nr:hypothetical protein [Micromonospora sp. NBC_01796]WSA83491.1 hypothetical protein OIE47_24220 [Micromonospora sp. NBC_01796]
MSSTGPGSTIDLISIPRAVASVAIGVVHSVERAVVGDGRVRTARGNAWAAICADRDRAHQRAEVSAMVAALTAPRSAPADERAGSPVS